MYSLLNTYGGLICSKFNLDGSLLAIGLDSSIIKIFSITNNSLKTLKNVKDLEKIDKNTGDIQERILDIDARKHTYTYVGHSASIQSLVFDPFNKYFLSASQDSTSHSIFFYFIFISQIMGLESSCKYLYVQRTL